jgi:AraC-like DNA-binding protein
MKWSYNEHRLSGASSNFIDCVWTEDYTNLPQNQGKQHLIFPDLSVELIFTKHLIKRSHPTGNESYQLSSHLTGLKTKPQYFEKESGSCLGVRIKPEALYLFAEISLKDSIDQAINISDAFNPSFIELEDRILSMESGMDLISQIDLFFNDLLKRKLNKRDIQFENMVAIINKNKGNCVVSDLAQMIGVSVKTVERKFNEKLGLSPKKYTRLVRLINALKNKSQLTSLTELAYSNFYYDQMHFIKDVKSFMGITPSQFFKIDKGIQAPTFC